MLATKTGIRRHGSAPQSYRSLVWLGRPANIASKLTDQANKPEDAIDLIKLRVAYNYGLGLTYTKEWPHEFVQKFPLDPARGLMAPNNSAFQSFSTFTERHVRRSATPPILMTGSVYSGFRTARPKAPEVQNEWFKKVLIEIPDRRHLRG